MKLVPDHRALAVDFHQTGLHQPIHVRIQAAEARRQLRWKHVDRALRKVDGRAAFVCFLVERGSLLDVVGHVRDMDTQPVVAVRQPLQRDRIVEIAGVLAVYRDREQFAEVGARPYVALVHLPADRLGLGDCLRRMRIRDVELPDDDLVVHARRVDVAEHFPDAAERAARRGWPSGNLHDHHVAGLCVHPLI